MSFLVFSCAALNKTVEKQKKEIAACDNGRRTVTLAGTTWPADRQLADLAEGCQLQEIYRGPDTVGEPGMTKANRSRG